MTQSRLLTIPYSDWTESRLLLSKFPTSPNVCEFRGSLSAKLDYHAGSEAKVVVVQILNATVLVIELSKSN